MEDRSPKLVAPSNAQGPKPRLSRWQAAREVFTSHLQALPEPDAGALPRLGCRGQVMAYSIAALVLIGVCVIVALSGNAATSSTPKGGSTKPAQTASAFASPTSDPQAGTLFDQQAAAFLAAYFSWDARDTDSTYAQRWQPYVVPAALPAFIASEPLATLDTGTDVAAMSPIPAMPPHAPPPGAGASLVVVWTIQVLPEGGEGAAWQPRQVQATLSLVEADGTWLVNTVAWSSRGARLFRSELERKEHGA